MILIVHNNGRKVLQVFRDAEKLAFSADPGRTLWMLAREFPKEILVWVEQEFHPFVQQDYIVELFKNDLIMASYAIKSKFLPGSIGYVDQLPYINVTRDVKYPTWRMSSDLGGIKGETLLRFEPLFKNIRNFDVLLNSVAKLGQQNGLFCYSDPSLLDYRLENQPVSSAGNTELFSFVYSYYKSVWTFVLFFCLMKYERTFPIMALIRAFFRKKMFGKNVELSEIEDSGRNEIIGSRSVDVVIPTIGRTPYIKQVVKDLSDQTLLPKKVIIVEQNPDPGSVSELSDLLKTKWPFEIIHLFTHQTGACMARNRALGEVKSTWTFFADDDIRIPESTLERAISEAERLRADGIDNPDWICGGFPCQPHSRANSNRKGFADERDLSGEMLRLVEEFEPAGFVGENTEGIIDTGLVALCDEMEKIGYFPIPISVPACAYGLPTLERHVWIIATTDRERSQRIVQKAIQNIESLQGEFQGSDTRIPDRWGVPQARVRRVCERISNGMDRIKALGNAVDPIMPELIGRAIMSLEI